MLCAFCVCVHLSASYIGLLVQSAVEGKLSFDWVISVGNDYYLFKIHCYSHSRHLKYTTKLRITTQRISSTSTKFRILRW